eukprot:TRINITY_DN1505_c1_g1_i1.p1 TRINITY_DN1505_c1_g1~~TRINITY_DN1505_c1_g1_i1.p1  ORF type:complete len:594 (-),score=153.05 TRINITY_DN1505_c1_g1_i1:52-1833(-)
MTDEEVPVTEEQERKVLTSLKASVFHSKVLEESFSSKRKWVLQSSEPSLKSAIFKAMYNNKAASDVTIRVGTTEFYLHRAFVGAWSTVFNKMFLSEEKLPHQTIEIKVSSERTPKIFEHLFKFMYFDVIAVPTAEFLSVLAIACKYQVEALIKECSRMSPELIGIKSTSSLLELSLKHYTKEMQPLIDKCNEMICQQFEEILKKPDFFNMSKDVLKGILARDDVAAEERDIYEGVKRWVFHSPDREAYLDEMLEMVRFPTMEAKYVAQLETDPIFSKSKILENLQMEALKFLADPAKVPESEKTANKKYHFRWYANVEEFFKYDAANETIRTYTIPANGFYRFTAKGAKAEDGASKKGGTGAIIEASFFLKKGDKLEILCGAMSKKRSSDTGGGGGTFVAINGRRNPLIVAGGGGGTRGSTGDFDGADASLTPNGADGSGPNHTKGATDGKGTRGSTGDFDGADASLTPNGADGSGPNHTKGATDGKGAMGCKSSYGGGGGGFFTDATPDGGGTTPGIAFVNGGTATPSGGFGGGGDAGNSGGGGGGGYSGGGAGQGAGGGGSFTRSDGGNVVKKVGHSSHGELRIKSVKRGE